jgi:hypothetical protein
MSAADASFTIEDYDLENLSRSPSPAGGYAEDLMPEEDPWNSDAERSPLRRSIHGEMSEKLQRRLNTYYAINRRVKMIKQKVQPLQARRAKPVYGMFREMQKRASRSLVKELSERCVLAYHEADMEPKYAVGWVLDMFPQETQFDLLRNYREEILEKMCDDEDMAEMLDIHFEKLMCVLFPKELDDTVRDVIKMATLKELGHEAMSPSEI